MLRTAASRQLCTAHPPDSGTPSSPHRRPAPKTQRPIYHSGSPRAGQPRGRPPRSAQLSQLPFSPHPPGPHRLPAAPPGRGHPRPAAPAPARLPALAASAPRGEARSAPPTARRPPARSEPPAPGGRPPHAPHQGSEVLPGEVRLPQRHSRLVPRHLGRKRKRGRPRGRLTPLSPRRRLRHARHSPPDEALPSSGTLRAGRRGATFGPAARRERLRRGGGQPQEGPRHPRAG